MIHDFMAQPITRGDVAIALGVGVVGVLGAALRWVSIGCPGSREWR